MKPSELIDKNVIELDLEAITKTEVIDELIDMLVEEKVIEDKKKYKKEILNRENKSTTAIGYGVAIPHAKSKVVKEPKVVLGRSKQGIDYGAPDDKDVKLFFMIAVNENKNDLHLKALANLSKMLMHQEFREQLLKVQDKKEVLEILRENEE